MKTLILTLTSLLCLSTFAQDKVLRSGKLYLNNNIYQIDVLLNPTVKNEGVEIQTSFFIDEDPCRETRYYCVTEAKIMAKDALQFIVKDEAGKILEIKTQDAELISTRREETGENAKCAHMIKSIDSLSFIHPHQFVDFESISLSMTTVFTGKVDIQNNKYMMSADVDSMERLDWFYNHSEARGSLSLKDPSLPEEDRTIDDLWEH